VAVYEEDVLEELLAELRTGETPCGRRT